MKTNWSSLWWRQPHSKEWEKRLGRKECDGWCEESNPILKTETTCGASDQRFTRWNAV